jgi:subtilisin family serine protease
MAKVPFPGCALFVSTAVASVLAGRPIAGPLKSHPFHALADKKPREVLIKLKRPLSADERTLLFHNLDADDVEELTGALKRLHSRSLDVDELASLLRFHDAVEYAEPNYIVHATVDAQATPSDPEFGRLWGMPAIHAPAAWDVARGSRANVVGVVDTGIDYTHPDLAANIWKAPAAFTVTVGGAEITCAAGTHGFNAITLTCDPRDDHPIGHGTHVAGTIAAVGNNGAGVAGVNWTASVMGLKFLDSNGTGTTADAINAIEFAVQAKQVFAASAKANVRVLSNSWGSPNFSQALLDEINRANALDVLFVAAAGNNGTDNAAAPFYPANYDAPNVVAVAASDSVDQRASFSNYGGPVDLAAPGVNILSTVPGGYGYLSGTSMATPHVSGAAALVLGRCALTTTQVKSALLSNVDVLGSWTGQVRTNGRLNADAAVRSCHAVPAAPANLRAWTGSSTGRITLVWGAVAGASSYKVKRSMLSGGPFSTIITLSGKTRYTNIGLTSDKVYYYVVKAVNGSGESAWSNKASAAAR